MEENICGSCGAPVCDTCGSCLDEVDADYRCKCHDFTIIDESGPVTTEMLENYINSKK